MGELVDKVKGNVNEAIGKAKQAIAGDSSDANHTQKDEELKAEGAAQELKGKAQQLGGKIKGALGDDI